MYQYSGKCSCGKVEIELSSHQEISHYTSRKCDCDFCIERDIEYLSDPKGKISFISKSPLLHEKQGSEQATFLLCLECQKVVGVCYIAENNCVGSLNAKLLAEYESLYGRVTISPKKLSNTEKVGRWSDVWSQVRIVSG